MTKAYNRVSWHYLIKILVKMGFSQYFTDMICRLIANNWYSILFNGQPKEFFHSIRGMKQEDPLSLALFVLSSEVLSRALNSLCENQYFKRFGLPKWSHNISHLAYADDTSIFTAADEESLKQIMKVLMEHEQVSGQLINIEKSNFYVYHKVSTSFVNKVEQVTGSSRGKFPFKYLGCPIFHNKKRKEYYNDLIKKVKDKLQNWRDKLLSYEGKVVLIESVLQSIPIYLLSVVVPTKYTINEIYKIFARFFWRTKEEGISRHWIFWSKLCLPKREGELGFRSLYDSKALFAKLWWRFRTTTSLYVE